LAAQILAISDPGIESRLEQFKKEIADKVAQKAEILRQGL
jgi:phosphoribosylcarboxyaminoimidazole (NCAIR) mutase